MLSVQNPVRGFLVGRIPDPDVPDVVIEFQYNPVQLADKRAAVYATLNTPGQLLPTRQYTQGGDRTISFTVQVDGLYDGPADDQIPISKDAEGSIAPELNKYRALLWPRSRTWPDAGGSFLPLYTATTTFAAPPECVFGFGDRTIDCVVTEVGITEKLFTPRLTPLRAEVSVTLVERVASLDGAGAVPLPGGG
jgi:hypothetical protein